MAQAWGNLGSVYLQKGEWERAIKMYEQSMEVFNRIGDVYGMASIWNNMALLYLEIDQVEEAKPLLVRAYSTFAQLRSPEAQNAANALVQACGSVDAANAYLAQLAEESADGEA
jgi:tetratricopeptide (TPR) repeat protein